MRWDSLLVRHVARELHERLRGRRASALRLDRERASMALRTGDTALVWDLRADGGGVRVVPAAERWKGNVPLAHPAVVEDVMAPPDERALVIRLSNTEVAPDSAARAGDDAVLEARLLTVVIELIGARWNAVVVGAGGRIGAVLRARPSGARPLAPGLPYEPLASAARAGATAPLPSEDWQRLLRPVPPADRERALLAGIAYTSPLNARHILGAAARPDGDAATLEDAYARYTALVWTSNPSPCLLRFGDGAQPYPFPLDGATCEPHATLLDAFNAAGGATPPAGNAEAAAAAALERVRVRRDRLRARIAKLRAELEGAAAEAPVLRRSADLLLSQLHRVRRGQPEVTLDDFTGGKVVITLDPALAPAENARRLYDAARKRERAAERIPRLLRKAEEDDTRWAGLAERIERGAAVPEEMESRSARASGSAARAAPRLPYRRYRTSSGLEVRVGRSAAANDALTLHHCRPDDIWMHARQVGGAHVVLRWADREANPPAPDLREAATLAAVHSRARTSGTVPVDWTRRKYVRKPRGAKPGLVMLERAKTLFVEPSDALEKRLREDTEAGDPDPSR